LGLGLKFNPKPKPEYEATQNFIFHSERFNMVIELGMGKSSKKKPLTKKERAEKKKRRKENRPK